MRPPNSKRLSKHQKFTKERQKQASHKPPQAAKDSVSEQLHSGSHKSQSQSLRIKLYRSSFKRRSKRNKP